MAFIKPNEERTLRSSAAPCMEKQKTDQQAAEQIGALLVDTTAPAEVGENDMAFIHCFPKVNHLFGLADNDAKRFVANQFCNSVDGADNLGAKIAPTGSLRRNPV